MCGIAGIISDITDRESKIDRMVGVMNHRGPDDHGTFLDSGIAIGMTRLAIIDLSPAGHQPMSNKDQTIWIVFNGEIYNFADEKNQLIKKGYQFRSTSDTEVIIALYEEYGVECVKHLRGMFALAIYDRRKGKGKETVLLARDHMGIKPLLYWRDGQNFVFGSEIKSMLASGLVPRQIDADSLRQALTWGSVVQPRTIIKNVAMLLPGHRIIINGADFKIERFWGLGTDRVKGLRQDSYQAQKKAVKNALEDSVKRQMIGDVPIGAFLSGGIDSGLTVAIMAKVAKAKVKTFSVGFEAEGKDIDETDDALKIAKHLGTDHTRSAVTATDIKRDIVKIASFLDQPTVDGVNSYYVSGAARKDVTVAISGTGGDELFAGYPWFINMMKYDSSPINPIKSSLAAMARLSVFDRLATNRFGTRLDRARGMGGFLPQFARQYKIFGARKTAKILSDSLRQNCQIGREPSDEIKIADELAKGHTIDRVTALTLRGYTQNQLLRDIDVASMAHSLEVRVPFLDPVVADLALSLSPDAKLGRVDKNTEASEITYRSSGAKRILVDIATEWLPKDIDKQPKRGFAMPFDFWLRGSLKDVVEDTLSKVTVEKRGLFDSTEVTRLKTSFENNQGSWAEIWLLVMTELWCREVLDEKN